MFILRKVAERGPNLLEMPATPAANGVLQQTEVYAQGSLFC
jgi:hypothetical protein